MRKRIPVVAAIAAMALASCSRPGPTPPLEVELPRSVSLNGMSISESAEGPWTIRAAGGGGQGRGKSGKDVPGSGGGRSLAMSEAKGAYPSSAPAPAASAFDAAAPEVASLGTEAEAVGGPGAEDSPARRPGEVVNSMPAANSLRAGSTDDNEEFNDFLSYLEKAAANPSLKGRFDPLDVAGREFLTVQGAEGKPLPGARVTVIDEKNDKVLWTAATYGDGQAPFYPKLAFGEEGPRPCLVEARHGGESVRAQWDGKARLGLSLSKARADLSNVPLDVLFVIDTTGSMGDEIQRVKETLGSVTRKLRSLGQEFSLRYGGVLYKDIGDRYVTMSHPFTKDIAAFEKAIQVMEASGGGDTPESLNQGLAVAVGGMEWRAEAAKVAFLIADAPPHMDYAGDVPYGQSLRHAVARGIRIHAVAASGLDASGSLVFRQIAQFTRGKFIFIEYGSVKASAATHGVSAPVKSNNLDDILFAEIRDEVARYGRTVEK